MAEHTECRLSSKYMLKTWRKCTQSAIRVCVTDSKEALCHFNISLVTE